MVGRLGKPRWQSHHHGNWSGTQIAEGLNVVHVSCSSGSSHSRERNASDKRDSTMGSEFLAFIRRTNPRTYSIMPSSVESISFWSNSRSLKIDSMTMAAQLKPLSVGVLPRETDCHVDRCSTGSSSPYNRLMSVLTKSDGRASGT